MRTSKNRITLTQLKLACRHVEELLAASVTENLAIRTLELFADVYAKMHTGGSATPHHVSQFDRWSSAALAVRRRDPEATPRDHYRVEHGTPRRTFARMVLDLHRRDQLDETRMHVLVETYWKIAVITVDEDARLNKIARSKSFPTPEERWAAAGIIFPEGDEI